MSKYKELCDLYFDSQGKLTEYWDRCAVVGGKIINRYSEFLSAPQGAVLPRPLNDKDSDREHGVIGSLSRNEDDGSYQFVIRAHIFRENVLHPQLFFYLLISIYVKSDGFLYCRFAKYDEEFLVDVDREETIDEFCEYLFIKMSQWLSILCHKIITKFLLTNISCIYPLKNN